MKKGGTFNFHIWTQKDYQDIAEILKIAELTQEQKEELDAIRVRYIIDRKDKLERLVDHKEYLEKLQRRTKRLIKTLQERNELSDQELLITLIKRGRPTDFLFSLQADLEALSKNLNHMNIGKDAGGNNGKFALKLLIQELAGFYQWITDKKPTLTFKDDDSEKVYSGIFFDLLTTVLEKDGFKGDAPARNASFGKYILRAVKT